MTSPTRRFSNDDDAAQHWLTLLRDGDPDQKITARQELAAIFERRGLFEEATDLLISNIQDGERSADIFRWLARLYRSQGQEVLAMQAVTEAAKYTVPTGEVLESSGTVESVPLRRQRTSGRGALGNPPPSQEPAAVQSPPSPVYVTAVPQQKRGGFFRIVGIGCVGCAGLVVLVVILLFAAGMLGSRSGQPSVTEGSPAKPGAGPTVLPKVGDTVQQGNWAYQVSKVDRQKQVTWTNFGNKLEAKGIWEVVHVKLRNTGKESFPINAHDFEIRDASGITYRPDGLNSSLYSSGVNLSKLGETFPPGVDAEVGLLTDVNPEAKGLQLWLVQARTAIDLGQ